MGERWGFRTEQLMELAGTLNCYNDSHPRSLDVQRCCLTYFLPSVVGLSCACAIQKSYPNDKFRHILFIAGPGSTCNSVKCRYEEVV